MNDLVFGQFQEWTRGAQQVGLPKPVREVLERGIEASKDAVGTTREAIARSSREYETAMQKVASRTSELTDATLHNFEVNSSAALDLVAQLAAAKDLKQVQDIQIAYWQKQTAEWKRQYAEYLQLAQSTALAFTPGGESRKS